MRTYNKKGDSKFFTPEELKILKSKFIPYTTAVSRLYYGWTKEEALELVERKKGARKGKSKFFTADEVDKLNEVGISLTVARRRLKRGWTLERILSTEKRVQPMHDWDNEEFALYKGDTLIAVGTVSEIAEASEKTVERIKRIYYRTHNGPYGKNSLTMYKLEDEREGE